MVPEANTNSLALKLIDYDGMWVPALARTKSGEVGHPCYQHPQRIREATYSFEVDRFPLLLIAAALCALKVGGRPLWEKYDNGDNLLFKETDLREPRRSTLFNELLRVGEPTTAALTAAILKALQGGLASAPLLDDLMPAYRGTAAPAIRFACPRCRTVLQTTEDQVGNKFPCPNCGQRLQVPAASPSAPSSSGAAS